MKSIKILFPFLILTAITLFSSCKTDDPSDATILPSNIINKMTIDKQGVKWIATDKGLASYDGKAWKVYSTISAIKAKPILNLYLNGFSESKLLWLGTTEGVIKTDISSQNLTISNTYRQTNSELLNDTVFSVASDANNVSYFGTRKGLSILKNSIWIAYDGRWGTKSKDNFLTKNTITAIATATNGWNYVATKGGGVSRFQYTDAVSGATKFFQPWAFGLKSDTVFTVIVVNDSCQWYGTTRGAAYHTSHNTKADWTSYTTADGLICDTVYTIAQDAQGTVWFGTHRGVSSLKNNIWTNYSQKDGLIADKVNTLAIDTDGSVWIGTDEGISHFANGKWENFRKK